MGPIIVGSRIACEMNDTNYHQKIDEEEQTYSNTGHPGIFPNRENRESVSNATLEGRLMIDGCVRCEKSHFAGVPHNDTTSAVEYDEVYHQYFSVVYL